MYQRIRKRIQRCFKRPPRSRVFGFQRRPASLFVLNIETSALHYMVSQVNQIQTGTIAYLFARCGTAIARSCAIASQMLLLAIDACRRYMCFRLPRRPWRNLSRPKMHLNRSRTKDGSKVGTISEWLTCGVCRCVWRRMDLRSSYRWHRWHCWHHWHRRPEFCVCALPLRRLLLGYWRLLNGRDGGCCWNWSI